MIDNSQYAWYPTCMTIVEFLNTFHSDGACEDFLITKLMQREQKCAECGHSEIRTFNRKARKNKYFECKRCGKQFTVLTDTVFHGTKLGLQKWFLCIYYMTITSKGISSVQLAKQVGITQKTAWIVLTKLRDLTVKQLGQFSGTVEADETFVGGKEKNKHTHKKGTTEKAVVMGVLQREPKQVKACHVPDTKAKTLKGYLYDNVKVQSNLMTDDNLAYRHTRDVYNHSVVKHGSGEYVNSRDKSIHTNSIESFWGVFKRGYIGVYHYMSKKHLQKYINEYTFRYNNKGNMFYKCLSLMGKKTKTYNELIS